MPIFEYICSKCHHRFEAIVLGKQKPKCPKCQNRRLEQQFSSFAVAGDKSSTGRNSAAACGT